LRKIPSKNCTLYYVQKSYRKENGKNATMYVEKLGTLEKLKERFGEEDPIGSAKKYIAELTAAEKEAKEDIVVRLSPTTFLETGERRSFNIGYLFLQKIYYELGLDYICKKIEKKHRNKYKLNDVLSTLLYTRVLYPGSKKSSLEDARKFIEQHKIDTHQIYRALSILTQEIDTIQADVYKNSLKLGERRTRVLYYDCTNYYFEIEEEHGLCQYGKSKENRPNPIVQMGMFMDMDGMPLAFCINPGNTAETVTLKPLEKKLSEDFKMSKLVVCTDCGLSSSDNRKNNTIEGRAFITVQSLKKLGGYLQDWALDAKGWHLAGDENTYDISGVSSDKYYDKTFFKERWLKEEDKNGVEGFSQRMIVTFSFKYMYYLRHLRECQLARAEALISKGQARVSKKSEQDPKRFIKEERVTKDGEVADKRVYSIDAEMVAQESRFDGFYAICTDLSDDAPSVIKANGGRWIIENGFRIMKSEFNARPVYLQRDDRIKAHFLTCFLALILYKCLEKKINRGLDRFTVEQIISQLKDMNMLSIEGAGYVPTYERTRVTNALNGTAGFRTDMQIVTKQKMRSIISSTKHKDKEE